MRFLIIYWYCDHLRNIINMLHACYLLKLGLFCQGFSRCSCTASCRRYYLMNVKRCKVYLMGHIRPQSIMRAAPSWCIRTLLFVYGKLFPVVVECASSDGVFIKPPFTVNALVVVYVVLYALDTFPCVLRYFGIVVDVVRCDKSDICTSVVWVRLFKCK